METTERVKLPSASALTGCQGWQSTKEFPLFIKRAVTEVEKENLDEGAEYWVEYYEGSFMAAVPTNKGWWIHYCRADVDGDLWVIGDAEDEYAGWGVEDVSYYYSIPELPFELEIEDNGLSAKIISK